MKYSQFVPYQYASDITCIPLTTSNFQALKKELQSSCCTLDSYLACPVYYLLTGRNGGYALKSGDQLVVVCQHPHRSDWQIIMPEIGPDKTYALTSRVLDETRRSTSKLSLGKYSEEEATAFRAKTGKHVEQIVDDTMDWIFPTRIYSSEIIAELSGSKFVKLRNKIRTAEKSGAFVEISDKIRPFDIQPIVRNWMVNHSARASIADDYYTKLAKLVRTYPTEFSGIRAFSSTGEMVGLIVWRIATDTVANIYAHIASRKVNGLADLLMWKAASYLNQNGIRSINAGGSEGEKLDDYKKKFSPILSLKQYSFEIVKSEQYLRSVYKNQIFIRSQG